MGLIEIRGLDVHDVDGIFLEVTKGFLMPPKVRGEDYTIAAAPGQLSGNRVAEYTDILIEGYVAGDSAEDWRANMDALIAVLDEDGEDPGELLVRGPLYGLGADDTAAINIRVVNIAEGAINGGYTKQALSIAAKSIDPRWVVTLES